MLSITFFNLLEPKYSYEVSQQVTNIYLLEKSIFLEFF